LCVEKYAIHWRKIGLELNLSTDILSIIEAKNRADHVNCCQDMLQKWLERDPEATWKRLFEAANVAFSLKSRSKDAYTIMSVMHSNLVSSRVNNSRGRVSNTA